MPTYSITDPNGKTYSIDGPPGATQEQVIAQIQAHQQAAPPIEQAAPRWDIPGDIGRSAEASAGAVADDASNAFPDPKTMDLGPIATLKRMGNALKVPLDALAVAASPVTGAIHGTLGSALSYAMPTPKKDVTSPDGLTTFYSDPKKAADQVIDSSMMGLGPRGMGSTAELGAAAAAREANTAARAEAKLKNRAAAKVSERAVADGLTPQQVNEAQKAANANGDKVTLMDLGNKNVRGLAGAVHRAPGPAGKQIGDFLEGRDTDASGALTQDIQGKVAKGSTYNAVQDLLNSRSAAARPAYDAAEAIGPVHSDRLQEFLGDPEIKAGLKRGLKLERQNARSENRPFKDSDYAVTGYKDGNWDEPIFGEVPTMKSMIVANEGLGAQIADMVNPATGRITKDGLALKKYRDAFQAELDSLSGGKYKSARDTWSGPAQSMEATQEGRQHFSRSESNEQLKAEFDALSPGDKDFYRMGAAEAKVDQLERAPDASDKSKRVINSERDRKRFRILFGSDAEADKFISSVARKRAAFETKTDVTRGSQTAGRQIEDADNGLPLGLRAAHGAGQVASGNWLGAARTAFQMKRELGLRNNPDLNSEIARILMEHDLPVAGGDRLLPKQPVPKRNSNWSAAIAAELAAAEQPSRKQPKP